MTFMTRLLGAAAALGIIAVPASAETLRFSSFEPPVAHVTKEILTPWAEDVSAASDGELTIQMFAGGSLGRNPAQQLQLVEDGVADIAWVIPGYSPGRFQESTVAELPFLIPSSTAGSPAMWKMYEDGHFKGDFDKLKMLGIFVSYPNSIASRKEVTVPEDMSGLKMRAPGPTMLSALEALGSVPVGGITGPTVAESISRGLIDGTFTQWGAIETFRMGDVITHFNTAPLGATPMLVVMNKAKYDSLSDKAKAAIDKFSGAAFSERFGASFDANIAEARDELLAKGTITVVEPDEAQLEQWKEAVAIATQQWIEQNENGQAIHDAFVKAVAEAQGTN
ncbi:TRAP transporter substrate-binding protein [Neoaquamicrobium sediminum]|uniref:TRAP transporter substrate-binding protein n=1 Tax=Neoaquamicrobium sediminum TaxID=1849104 RepID=UPI0019D5259C|nr:TRAP transporter substrate-binding protein [Mesorhizobium sediminum]MBX9463812.1 TRAP transporter substrate-binding protein [Aquamicrobium sp.]